jgi:hypothetical protein
MSRAFVKDADETFDELPDRPISPHPNFVTAEGLAAIEAALARLQQERAHWCRWWLLNNRLPCPSVSNNRNSARRTSLPYGTTCLP